MMPSFKPDTKGASQSLVCFATAFGFLLAGMSALVWNSQRLATGQFASPQVVGGLHLFTLGWLSLSIFGALRVFSGVALGSSGYITWLPAPIWAVWTVGALLFPSGLFFGYPWAIISGILLITVALTFFSIHFIPALVGATRGRLAQAYLSIAIASLWGALLLGSGAGFIRAGWFAWQLPAGYFQAHILIAIFGWVGSTIIGVGSHLIPMFALSNNPRQWPVKVALPIWIMIPTCGAVGAFYPAVFLPIAWVAAAVGSILWGIQVYIYFNSRLRKERDWGLFIAASATIWLLVAWLSLIILRSIGRSPDLGFIGTLLIGWLTLFTLGIYHRVVPFLVWFQRFAGKAGRGRTPRVKEMTSDTLAKVTAVSGLSGSALWSIGLYTQAVLLIYFGSGMMLGCIICSLLQLHTLYGVPGEKTQAAIVIPGEAKGV